MRIRLCPDPVEDQEGAALEAARAAAEALAAEAVLEAAHAEADLEEDLVPAALDRADRGDPAVPFSVADGFIARIITAEADVLAAC